MTQVTVSTEDLPQLEKQYDNAFRAGREYFFFKGTKVYVPYAKYLIEYLKGTYHD